MVEEYLMHLSLKEILTIALTIIALVIAIYAFFVYKILSKALRNQAKSEANKTMMILGSKMFINLGYVYWKDYEITTKGEYLDMAIIVTEDAYDDYAKNLNESEHEFLICTLKNNLAYYYAKRKQLEDGAKARHYAEDILFKSHKFETSKRKEMIETYKYVQRQFPKSQMDVHLERGEIHK